MKRFFNLLIFVSLTQCDANDPLELKNQWASAGSQFDFISWPLKQHFIKYLKNVKNSATTLDDECNTALKQFAHGLDDGNLWALQMFDSFAKFKPGIFSEKYVDFGHYHQCLESSNEDFRGKYTLLSIQWPLQSSPRLTPENLSKMVTSNDSWLHGITSKVNYFYYEPMILAVCVPSVCQLRDLELIAKAESSKSSFTLKVMSVESYSDGQGPSSTLVIASRVILATLTCITLGSTLYFWFRPASKISSTIFQHFDAVSNTEKLFLDSRSPKLSFFNGIKFVYLILCVVSHLFLPMTHGLKGMFFLSERFMARSDFAQGYGATGASYLAINMIVGSSLSIITWFPEIEKRKGKVSFFSFFVIRYLRSIPVVIACIMILLAFPQSPGLGPLFPHVLSNMTANCVQYGWTELLFLSNQLPTEHLCFGVGWYLSADFQLYLSSFLVIMLLFRNQRKGIYAVVSAIVLGIMIQSYVLFVKPELNPVMVFSDPDMRGVIESMPFLHMHTNNYIVPYFIGLLTGFFIITNQQLPKTYFKQLWSLSIFLLTVPSIVITYLIKTGISHLTGVFVGPIYRAFIAAGFGLFVFMTWSDRESFFNRMLSNKFFDKICRIMFPAFMMHMLVIIHMYASQTDTFEFNPMNMLSKVLYVLFFAFTSGYLLYLIVEAPFVGLTKILIGKNSQVTNNTSNSSNSATILCDNNNTAKKGA